MIGKIFLLAIVAACHARHVEMQIGTIPSDRCPPVGHHLLPHEWDCTKFYYCEYGEKWVTPRDCAPGTEFSYALQVCVHPAAANCELSRVPPESEEVTEEPETVAPETEAPTTPPRPTTEAPTEPPTEETEAPTEAPTVPTEPETEAPTEAPTEPETEAPTEAPTTPPRPTTEAPTEAPTEPETEAPTEAPTETPTEAPTTPPTPTTEPPTEPETEAPEQELLPNGCPADFDVHQLLPHEARCDKFYYCVQGEKVERECSNGLWFNPAIQVCDWPQNGDCINADSSEPPEDLEGSGDPVIDNEEFLPNGCPADFGVHKLLPHESDCGKFYYCVFGETVERQCAEGTLFNSELQVCDWPQNVDCSNADSSEPPEDLEGSGEAGIDNEELLPNGCPADFGAHKLLPHESDCGKFYYCVLGETAERQCAEGTLFNSELQVCDWPENAGCTNSGSGGENTTPEAEITTSAPITPTEAPEQELLPNGCPADFDVHQLLPHESNCSKFYYCVHGETVERECPDGLYFNTAIQVCDWPENAGCTNSGSGGENTTPEAEITTSAPITPTEAPEQELLSNGCPADFDVHQLLPHESNCSKFYYCVHGETVERECADGLYFNPAIQVCDWPENAGCTNSGNGGENTTPEAEITTSAPITPTEAPEQELLPNGCPADFDVHQLLPHESNCSKFYYCVHGETVERDCPGGLYFNPDIQVCDWPQNAGCVAGGSAENENSTDTETSPSDKCRSSCNIPPWADEDDCNKFWRCDGENAVLGTCSEGLHFNVNTQTCDFIDNAGCVGDLPSTREHDGLKFLPRDKVEETIRKLYLTGHQ